MPVRDYGEEELKLVKAVLDSGRLSVLSGGTMQRRFERAFAKAHQAKHAVAMNSAMSVLHASLMTAGVDEGVEVVCDPVCVFGALAVLYQRGKPVFVDCEPVTFNMDPHRIEETITERTKAVVVTHVGGLPARMDRIMRVARKHKLFVIEDCAHAFLATYKGRFVGTWGDIGSFSFQASKHLGVGDGGMALTNKKKVADALGLHAGAPTFFSVAHGVHYNFRMNEQTAAIGLAQLPKVKRAVRELIRIARLWDAAIADCPWLVAQQGPPGAQSTYHLWIATFMGEDHGLSRRRFLRALKEFELPFSLGYTKRPAYRHPVFAKVFPPDAYPDGLCPNAERLIPRMLVGYPMVPLDSGKRTADKLRQMIASLG